ncbi:MAG: cell division protein FtsQ/DivIB [bacterium]
MIVYSKYSTVHRGKRLEFATTRRMALVLLIITTTLLLMLKVAGWLNAQAMFTLKDIRVEGNRFVKESDIVALLQLDGSRSLFEYDLKAMALQVKQHPLVQNAWVSRRLPDNLVIKVLEKEPLAILNQDTLAILDDRGERLPNLATFDPMDFPIISNIETSERHRENGQLYQILNFLRLTRRSTFSLYCQISEISYSETLGLYFYLIDRPVPVIVGKGNFAEKSLNLLQVLKIIRKENSLSQIQYFDLRYQNQVIVKKLKRSLSLQNPIHS